MGEKIRPIYFRKPDGEAIKLYQPAFLVGNGINCADGRKFKWKDLLSSLLDEKKTFTDLTYPEIAEIALSQKLPEYFDKKGKTNFMQQVVKIIKKKIENAKRENKNHQFLVNFAHSHKIPILTTNFDRNFLKILFPRQDLDDIELKWFKSEDGGRRDYQTLKNAYYRKERLSNKSDIHSEFAIWYIHGIINQPESICLTNWDYGNYYSKIKEVSKERNKNGRKGDSTWIDILLDNDLIIMGLGLDSSETDLRALLVERIIQQKLDEDIAKKAGRSHKRTKTIYIYSEEDKDKDNEKTLSKIEFFKALGIKCVPIPQDDIFKLRYMRIGKCKNKYIYKKNGWLRKRNKNNVLRTFRRKK